MMLTDVSTIYAIAEREYAVLMKFEEVVCAVI